MLGRPRRFLKVLGRLTSLPVTTTKRSPDCFLCVLLPFPPPLRAPGTLTSPKGRPSGTSELLLLVEGRQRSRSDVLGRGRHIIKRGIFTKILCFKGRGSEMSSRMAESGFLLTCKNQGVSEYGLWYSKLWKCLCLWALTWESSPSEGATTSNPLPVGSLCPSSIWSVSEFVAQRGVKKWTQTLFLKFFGHPQDIPAKIQRYPAKKFVSLGFRGTYRTFWPPPLHVEDPHHTGRYADPRVWVCASYSCLIGWKTMGNANWIVPAHCSKQGSSWPYMLDILFYDMQLPFQGTNEELLVFCSLSSHPLPSIVPTCVFATGLTKLTRSNDLDEENYPLIKNHHLHWTFRII